MFGDGKEFNMKIDFNVLSAFAGFNVVTHKFIVCMSLTTRFRTKLTGATQHFHICMLFPTNTQLHPFASKSGTTIAAAF